MKVEWTPLERAAADGLTHEVKRLLEEGALLKVKTKRDRLGALYTAVMKGHPDVVKVLVDHGVEWDPDDAGLTVAIKAAWRYFDADRVSAVICALLSLDPATDRHARRSLRLIKTAVVERREEGVRDVMKALSGDEAALNNLLRASRADHRESTEMPRGYGAGMDQFREQLIHDMAEGRQLLEEQVADMKTFMRGLFQAGETEEDLPESREATYEDFIEAVEARDIKAVPEKPVEPRQEHGAEVDQGSEQSMQDYREFLGKAAEDIRTGLIDVLKFQRGLTEEDLPESPGGEYEDLIKAIEARDMAAVRRFLEEGADSTTRDVNSGFALSCAVSEQSPKMVKLLLEKGADPCEGCEIATAAASHNTEVVKLLLDYGESPNVKDATQEDCPVLMIAIFWEATDVVRVLLERGADPDTEYNDLTAVEDAALNGRTDIVKLLLNYGAHFDPGSKNGKWLLQKVTEKGHGEVLKVLVRAGEVIDPNVRQRNRWLAVDWTRDKSRAETVEKLLQSDVDPNTRLNSGRTPIMLAAQHFDAESLRLLLARGADVNARDRTGRTALMFASDAEEAVFIKDKQNKGNVRTARLLLDNGADINSYNEDGHTALMLACQSSNTKLVELLLSEGADVNPQAKNGRTPLMLACEVKNAEIVESLLDAGADVNLKDEEGETALLLALCYAASAMADSEIALRIVEKGADVHARASDGATVLIRACGIHEKPELVKLLLDKGVDVNAIDDYGSTALKECWSPEVREMLRAKAGKPKIENIDDQLLEAVKSGNLAEVKRLIEEGANIYSTDEHGKNPLMIAAANDHVELVDFLMRSGADISGEDVEAVEDVVRNMQMMYLKEVSKYGPEGLDEALLDAAEMPFGPDVKELLARGANINAQDEEGNTPLMKATEFGLMPTVTELLAKGADPNVPNAWGETPLMSACSSGDEDLVRLLLENGADANAEDETGTTALGCALNEGHAGVAELLRAHGAKE